MNLTHLIDLFFGGPGSGCDPEVAEAQGNKCGRPKGSGTGERSTARLLSDRIKKDGGFTYKPASRRSPHVGFALSISPEHERVLSLKDVTPEKIKSILAEYSSVLKSEPRAHVGGWVDPESQKVFLDVSIVVRDRKEAIQLGKKYNQLAVYDLAKGKTVKTGVKRKIKAQKENKLIRVEFPRDATPEEIAETLNRMVK